MAMPVDTGLFLRKWAYGLAWLVLAVVGSKTLLRFFYIYFITILQKFMVGPKFCKTIHLPPWPTASGT
jgi:hypothetical protein